MRITTQMLNETAKRTGIPINRTSLLDYVNNDSSSSQNSLLDALKKNDKTSSSSVANYKKLEKAASALKEQADKLAETGEKSFWEKFKDSEDPQEVYAAVGDFVDSYNSTISNLKKSTGVLDQYYLAQLKDAAADYSEELGKIGITVGKDGMLSIDSKKLGEASVEEIQNALSKAASKTAFIADRISNNAQAGIESTSSQYNGAGSLVSQLASRYDFWG
ncbi:MAG: hypothetical protein K2N87_15770 [Eubacterium sp.]|nr:hypothetical protein [Eubacterium sp.]